MTNSGLVLYDQRENYCDYQQSDPRQILQQNRVSYSAGGKQDFSVGKKAAAVDEVAWVFVPPQHHVPSRLLMKKVGHRFELWPFLTAEQTHCPIQTRNGD